MAQGSTPRSGRLPTFDGSRTILPREGPSTPAPAWPLPGDPSPREAQLWDLEWARPQALIWTRDGLENDVALYVRKRAEAEAPGSSSASVDTMRRLADDLLLTIPAMRRAGVAIGDATSNRATLVPLAGGTGTGRPSAKDRFAPSSRQSPPSSRERFRRASDVDPDPAPF